MQGPETVYGSPYGERLTVVLVVPTTVVVVVGRGSTVVVDRGVVGVGMV
jgi:hypothetical protein